MAEDPIRIGAIPDFYCRPVLAGLQQPESPASAGLFFESAGINAERILGGECDAALIGPVEFARNSSDFSLYPSIGVASRGESRTSVLCVNRSSHAIGSIAVGAVSSSDIVLAKIILSEKFEQQVVVVPVLGTVPEMLSKADAALVTGNASLTSAWEGPTLDLVDEWSDMTDLPYVHLVCAGRKEKYKKEIAAMLLASQEQGAASIPSVALQQSNTLPYPVDELERQLEHFTYGFDDEAREALGEFFRYAFYLGIFPDVPEIEVFGGEQSDNG